MFDGVLEGMGCCKNGGRKNTRLFSSYPSTAMPRFWGVAVSCPTLSLCLGLLAEPVGGMETGVLAAFLLGRATMVSAGLLSTLGWLGLATPPGGSPFSPEPPSLPSQSHGRTLRARAAFDATQYPTTLLNHSILKTGNAIGWCCHPLFLPIDPGLVCPNRSCRDLRSSSSSHTVNFPRALDYLSQVSLEASVMG